MAKTVLEYVQYALDTMDSDAVDSISDTEESLQVAAFLKETYYEILNREEWKFLDGPAALTSLGDVTKPTSFTIAGTTKYIHSVSYNVADAGSDAEFRELEYLEPIDFLRRYSVPGDNRQLVSVGNNLSFYLDNSKQPRYYTSFGDQDIVLDSWDSSIETTANASKVLVYANTIPDFTISDSFVPDIPQHMEPLLQSSLNAISHLYLVKQVSAPDEARAGRQMAQARRAHSKVTRRKYYTRRYGRR